MTRKWLRPVRPLCALDASRTAPQVRSGSGRSAYRYPPIVAVPAMGVTRLSSMRSVVVLPAPFGPRKPVTRPGSTVNDRSSTALTRLYCLVRPETTICPSMVMRLSPLLWLAQPWLAQRHRRYRPEAIRGSTYACRVVHYAVGLPVVGEFGDPLLLTELAVGAEEHGWDGVYLWDHVLYHHPQWSVASPVVTLAAIAARTSRVRLGVLVTALARRRVQVVARETATLDVLSGGRLVFGAGLGSMDAEYTAFGEDPDLLTRAVRLDESLNALVALWSGEPVSMRGELVRVSGVQMRPTPVQRPRIPVWCAGKWPNRAGFRRGARAGLAGRPRRGAGGLDRTGHRGGNRGRLCGVGPDLVGRGDGMVARRRRRGTGAHHGRTALSRRSRASSMPPRKPSPAPTGGRHRDYDDQAAQRLEVDERPH